MKDHNVCVINKVELKKVNKHFAEFNLNSIGYEIDLQTLQNQTQIQQAKN